jgi:hypothetical protein
MNICICACSHVRCNYAGACNRRNVQPFCICGCVNIHAHIGQETNQTKDQTWAHILYIIFACLFFYDVCISARQVPIEVIVEKIVEKIVYRDAPAIPAPRIYQNERERERVPTPPPPGHMVGLGLALEIWSNGRATVEQIIPGFAAHKSNQFQVEQLCEESLGLIRLHKHTYAYVTQRFYQCFQQVDIRKHALAPLNMLYSYLRVDRACVHEDECHFCFLLRR